MSYWEYILKLNIFELHFPLNFQLLNYLCYREIIILSYFFLSFMSECYIHGLQNQFETNVYCNYSSKLKSVLFFNFHQTILREWSYNHLFQNDTMGKSEVKYTFFTLYCLHINYHSAFSVLAPYSYFIFSSFFFISKFLSNR